MVSIAPQVLRPVLSVLVVSFNTKDLTVQTVESVLRSVSKSPTLAQKTELIVLDNGSSDGSVTALDAWWQSQTPQMRAALNFHLIAGKKNLGFGGANNKAVTEAHGEYILFLNSDTVVLGTALADLVEIFRCSPIDDTTSALAGARRIDRLGILSPGLQNPDGTTQLHGGCLPTLFHLLPTLFFLDDLPGIGQFFPAVQQTGWGWSRRHADQPALVSQGWVGGTAMMVRRQLIDEIGVFDQNIFMYGEDMELCLRAAHHHWDCAVAPKIRIVHYGSASSSVKNAILGEFAGYVAIWAKHFPRWQTPVLQWLLWLSAHLKAFVFGTMKKQPERAAAYRQWLKENS